ncbi:D-alanyl-D-alanine carboxypeptidase-like protein [Serratia fonticola]|uniref:D-alanyl-D-alanine carboxypeptidase-like protein n=1 Tax=Serratia fonticola TaxID=47917 RepID=A0A542BSP7_SERFO|nr:M15 family metallopeptidase [Serratia fonticola]TQI81596.1 D-alanyl-D-alanine carboxypeptidase-like protein [Serratia fonticola]TQI96381.1 D-alanyl-D-alanine carboxypeptidase-like protein [Serratia fonticola]TVZ70878.1 D-alanyl-D-alanine carboxypeptidase-like protein [Serratia fonticola]
MISEIPEIQFTTRSEQHLLGVHPDLVRVMRLALRYSLVPFSITEGVRSMARQRELLREGKTQTLRSRHLTGHAVDVVAMPAGTVSWVWDYYAQIAVAVRRAARECGIDVEWGGEWKTLKDGPHFQLSFKDYPA